MQSLEEILSFIEEKVLFIMLFLVCIVTLVQIFARFIPFIPVPTWTEEIVRYLFMWMVYFGVSNNIKHKEHIKADFLANKLFAGKSRFFLSLFKNTIILFFCVIIIIEGCKLCFIELKTQRIIISLPIPIYIISMVIPVSFGFSAFHIIFDLFVSEKRRNS